MNPISVRPGSIPTRGEEKKSECGVAFPKNTKGFLTTIESPNRLASPPQASEQRQDNRLTSPRDVEKYF